MNFLPKLANAANVVFQNFFNPEWDENAGFFAYKPQEAVMIVVGMMFKIEGPDGQNITPSDIAQVLKYRDQRFFADVTGNMVRDFFRNLERNKADRMNPYAKWESKRQVKEERKAKGHPEEPDPEFDAIKGQLQKDLQAAKK